MDNLITIWHDQVAADSFCNIKELVVEFCENVLHVFNSDMPKRFKNLTDVHISDCASLEEVFEVAVQGQNSNVEVHVVTTTYLSKMYLVRLPRLKNVWNKDYPNICSFQNLRQIYAEGCESLKSFFPVASVTTSLRQLEDLQIINCGIEEIVARGGEEATPRFVFPRMTTLNLGGLTKLKWFYPGVHTSKWPSLKNMRVDGCQKVEIFASDYKSLQEGLEESRQSKISSDQPLFLVDQDQVTFPSLEILIISHMDDMKVIWNTQFAADSFCRLQMMRVEACANLNSIFPFKMFNVFQSLELVNIVGCSSLEQVFDLQGPSFHETSDVIVTQLKHLYLSNLPKLKNISNKDPRNILSFQNLHDVRANGCESMECLFPASMARTLTKLESLEVIDCGVEAIAEKKEAEGKLVFPKLTSLALGALPKLKWIFPGVHNLEWPVLKELNVWRCDQVSIFASKSSCFQETSQQCLLESSIQHPLFLVEEDTFPKLEVLKSDIHHTTWCDQFLVESFCKLKVLVVKCNHDTSAISPSNLLTRLQNLEKLFVSCNYWQEIFPYEEIIGRGKHARILPQLKELRVSKAHMLTQYLWKEDVQESLVFCKELEVLAVSECHKLKSLVSSSVCFQNLKELEILNCKGLINLITYRTAKSLVQLRKMSVSSCEEITEIVARGDDEAKVVITFSKLTCLKFDCLPSFTSFCSGSYSIMFPYLKEVIVGGCPGMKTFCHGVLSTPRLESVQATREEKSYNHWMQDLNTTIHWLWEDKLI
ncbi:hypothetical protein I3843_16G077300 [Carya illinoinensis]|nr:hypothetical protein I3843_16G077300 [Carya illinoinensis]